MISANILKGKDLTYFVGIRDDVINSGGNYRDEEVVVDANLVTSRTPKDEPAFIREILAKLNLILHLKQKHLWKSIFIDVFFSREEARHDAVADWLKINFYG